MTLYGFAKGTLSEIAMQLERAFGLKLELHESQMYGGDYCRYEADGEQIILQSNRDHGDIAEEDFPDIPILLWIASRKRTREELDELVGPDARLLRL